jgi:hypothetical protein
MQTLDNEDLVLISGGGEVWDLIVQSFDFWFGSGSLPTSGDAGLPPMSSGGGSPGDGTVPGDAGAGC